MNDQTNQSEGSRRSIKETESVTFEDIKKRIKPMNSTPVYHRVLIFGPSGSGKTPLALETAGFLEKARSLFLLSTEAGAVHYDCPNADSLATRDISEVDTTLAGLTSVEHPYGVVVLDQLTDLYELRQIEYSFLDTHGVRRISQENWGVIKREHRENIILKTFNLNAHLIAVCEEKTRHLQIDGEEQVTFEANTEPRDSFKFDTILRLFVENGIKKMRVIRDRSQTFKQDEILTGDAITLKPFFEKQEVTKRDLGRLGNFEDVLKLFAEAPTPSRVNQIASAWHSRISTWTESEQSFVKEEQKQTISKLIEGLRLKSGQALEDHAETLVQRLEEFWTSENKRDGDALYKIARATTKLPILTREHLEALDISKIQEIVAQVVARLPDDSFFSTLKTQEKKS